MALRVVVPTIGVWRTLCFLTRIIYQNNCVMKTLWIKTIMLLFLGAGILHAQNREEVPGDNFSLEGALELFKKSASPEEFERLLNLPESEVNNLDLNGDNKIDYIRVINRQEGNVHAFSLQAVISRYEFQDIAVITLEKQGDGKAVLQITGDADIYGIETIIEPTEEVRINAGTTASRRYANVWTWPMVQYVYTPYYSPWVSPWYWDYHPYWWSPWRPVSYWVYYPRWVSYHSHYSYCDAPRIRYAYRIYEPYRSSSIIVYNRHRDQITKYRSTRTVYGDRRGDYNRNDYPRGRDYNSNDRSRSSREYTRDTRSSQELNTRETVRRTDREQPRSNGNVNREFNDRLGAQNKPSVSERVIRETPRYNNNEERRTISPAPSQRESRSSPSQRTITPERKPTQGERQVPRESSGTGKSNGKRGRD